jgi:hypothetical protein
LFSTFLQTTSHLNETAVQYSKWAHSLKGIPIAVSYVRVNVEERGAENRWLSGGGGWRERERERSKRRLSRTI